MAPEREWYGPLSPFVSDAEKNEAVNRIDRDLAEWRKRNASGETPAQPTTDDDKETACRG
jgi:hypothetical protein